MAKTYYFSSDMHQGGDGQLMVCDYMPEYVKFLEELEWRARGGEELEYIIMGDTFGLWEFTTASGPERIEAIMAEHAPIYDQMKRLGEVATVTMMVGNHDYDMACNPEYAEILKRYNIRLDTSLQLTRQFGERKIWIEHGQQSDVFNRSDDYGNPHALPVGYFITEIAVSGAAHYSVFGRGNWLKDIRSVGTLQIPDWVLSNYFYREMNSAIRWFLIPLLTMLSIAFVALILGILHRIGLIPDVVGALLEPLGFVGDILWIILAIDAVILIVLIIIGIPLYIFARDIRRTLRRFQLLGQSDEGLVLDPNKPYIDRANEVFAENDDVAAYLFGHTHAAFLSEEEGRVIINTGSWLKLLTRVPVRFGFLPGVYYPQFRLSYYKIYGEGSRIVVEYHEAPKTPSDELTWLQKVVLAGNKPKPFNKIPARTEI
jgi:UDP-2,3-diacylglucosamine pyrophosphatase LpxH